MRHSAYRGGAAFDGRCACGRMPRCALMSTPVRRGDAFGYSPVRPDRLKFVARPLATCAHGSTTAPAARSLVPMDRNSTYSRIRSASSAAAGTSTITRASGRRNVHGRQSDWLRQRSRSSAPAPTAGCRFGRRPRRWPPADAPPGRDCPGRSAFPARPSPVRLVRMTDELQRLVRPGV